MTRNQGIPERQPPGKPPKRGDSANRSPRPNPTRSPNSTGQSPAPKPRPQAQPAPVNPFSQTAVAAPPPVSASPARPIRDRWLRWLYSWKVWLAVTVFLCGGSGVLALLLLLQIPGLPNCPAIFWPLASASLRFECARLAASKQTAKDLLEAIALVDSLPPNHSLRAEADRLVEEWSQDVLKLAEADFDAGKLADAIAAARRIPSKVTAAKLVEERVKRWQSIWAEAEGIYKKTEAYLRQQNFRQAFSQAVRLLDVENRYWRTTKFDELNNHITTARSDGNKLGKAERLADEGGLNNLLEAIKLAKSIRPESYIYQAAQKAIPKFGRRMIEMAQAALDRQDLKTALNILDKVPNEAKLKDEVRDFTILANAQSQVWQNTIPGVEEAISQAQRIGAGSPVYRRAQQLIVRWQLEIEAIAQLEKARLAAQSGSIEDLTAGIAEASLVARSNPRWNEAQQQIRRWQDQIQTIQDRPLIDQADQLASGGDVSSLQAAIAQAEQVGQGRALSGEARSKIRKWTAQVQRIQDEPILVQARESAKAGDLKGAISLAQQIQPGRSLSAEAQADVNRWREQIQAEAARAQAIATLQAARQLANAGSPTDLASAIQMADRVSSNALRGEASSAVNEWSQQLLQVAKTQADYDVPGAISIAQKIPARATAYAEAQTLIQSWKRSLGL